MGFYRYGLYHLCEQLAHSCVTFWLSILKGNAATSDWEACYPSVSTIANKISTIDDGEVNDNESVEEIGDGWNEKGEYSKGGCNVEFNSFELED
jgi:hypothetical protein